MFTFNIVLIVLCFIPTITAYEVLHLKNPTTKSGFVYPNRAEPGGNVTFVLEGIDVLIYLAKVPENYEECKITTPDSEITYSLDTNGDDENSKVAFWTPDSKTSGCGARIKNVTIADNGRWRLQAVSIEEDHLYQSFINLVVIKNFNRTDGDFIIREGAYDGFNITKYASYCEISDPVLFGDHKLFDQCQVDLANITKLYGGKWTAKVGVLGKIDEIILQPKVEVVGEKFEVGTNKTEAGSKINLFCNLKNAIDTNVTFCRFIRNGTDFGLRLSEGLSNGNYSYFGRRLKDGDCGVTIENPKSTDFGLWKCSLGIHRLVNTKQIMYEVKEAIISLTKNPRRNVRAAEKAPETIEEILAGLENPLYIYYKTDFQIKYCIIIHPNGTQYAINERFSNNDWQTISDINVGDCGMTIYNTTYNETGLWKMQIGHYDTHSMDKVVHIPVRVGEYAMVAISKIVIAEEDSPLTIKCKAVAKKPFVLEYCRFTLPDGTGFQIDPRITEDDPIEGLYWYNDTSLEDICQVTIKAISSEHYGQWYCSGKIKGSKRLEDFDDFLIQSEQLSVASISGIAAGIGIIGIAGVGGLIYYRKKTRPQPQRGSTYLSTSSRSSQSEIVFERNDPLVSAEGRQPQEPEVVEEIEMRSLSRAQSRTSGQSRPSATHSRPSSSAISISAESMVSANSRVSVRSRASTSASFLQTEGTIL